MKDSGLAKLAYEGIIPGNYMDYGEVHSFGFADLADRGFGNVRGSFRSMIRSPRLSRRAPSRPITKSLLPTPKEEKEDESFLNDIGIASPALGDALYGEASSAELPDMPKKPEAILRLENVLSSAYNTNIKITSVKELPVTRKQVKEVYFFLNSGISKVWVFKAEPEKTAYELCAYHIAYEQGVPTGKPIGYSPKEHKEHYPFDIAILGGIVEHAGEPYNQLIRNMELEPKLADKAAKSIARMIADYQVRLTAAKNKFDEYGVKLPTASPRKELKERMLPILNVKESDLERLVRVCERFSKNQESPYVISHGDIHTGNIVTILDTDIKTGLQMMSIERFGVIDWGSIAFDNPYGDLVDFFVHHSRLMSKLGSKQDSGFSDIDNEYRRQLEISGKQFGLKLEINPKDALVQSILWNLYEMYDPARKDQKEIEEKYKIHCDALADILNKDDDLTEQKRILKKELGRFFKDTYLNRILSSKN